MRSHLVTDYSAHRVLFHGVRYTIYGTTRFNFTPCEGIKKECELLILPSRCIEIHKNDTLSDTS